MDFDMNVIKFQANVSNWTVYYVIKLWYQRNGW